MRGKWPEAEGRAALGRTSQPVGKLIRSVQYGLWLCTPDPFPDSPCHRIVALPNMEGVLERTARAQPLAFARGVLMSLSTSGNRYMASQRID